MQSDLVTFDRDNLKITVHLDAKGDLMVGKDQVSISHFSGGPGGQNVNKNMNGVRLIYRIPDSHRRFGQKTQELIARSMAERSQHQNLLIAFEILAYKLQQYFYIPPARVGTKVSKSSRKKRLQNKKHRSHIKSLRQKADGDL